VGEFNTAVGRCRETKEPDTSFATTFPSCNFPVSVLKEWDRPVSVSCIYRQRRSLEFCIVWVAEDRFADRRSKWDIFPDLDFHGLVDADDDDDGSD